MRQIKTSAKASLIPRKRRPAQSSEIPQTRPAPREIPQPSSPAQPKESPRTSVAKARDASRMLKRRYKDRMENLLMLIEVSNLAIDRHAYLQKARRVAKNYNSTFKKNKPIVVSI